MNTVVKRIRILIAEDHDVVREGLKILISSDPNLVVAGEASSGDEAVAMAAQLKPDVVLMDLAMPNGNGLQATRQICLNASAPRVLVLSAYQDEESVRGAFRMGACGYITKHSAASDLLAAVRQVCGGRQYFSPRIASMMRSAQRRDPGQSAALTPREHEVLALLASGLSNKQVGSALNVSTKTVEKHRQHVMDKLNIHEIAGLTRYAMERGIIPIPEINGADAVGAHRISDNNNKKQL